MSKKKAFAAAALKYNSDRDRAPRLVASGQGKVAETIEKIAIEANVPIVEDAALISALLALEVGDEIPEQLYLAVAKILSFLYTVDSNSSG